VLVARSNPKSHARYRDLALNELSHIRFSLLAKAPDETARPADLTRKALEPYLQALGITRVGDITGLDRIGVPVWFATRPASRALSVSQGKGLDHDRAWITAVMESAETALAEQSQAMVTEIASIGEMARKGLTIVPLERQSRCAAAYLDPNKRMAWVPGLSWLAGKEVYAPYELIGMDMTAASPWNHSCFQMSSLGLAAAGTLYDAMRHGLQELVEDDAFFSFRLGGWSDPHTLPLGLAAEASHPLSETIKQCEAVGYSVRLAKLRTDIDLPTVLAGLDVQAGGQVRCYTGCATRNLIGDAALAALLEAIQSKLTFVSGSRDDLWPEDYRKATPPSKSDVAARRSVALSGETNTSLRACLKHTLDEVVKATGSDIYFFPIPTDCAGIRAVRVLADDLVSSECPPLALPSPRAKAKLMGGSMP